MKLTSEFSFIVDESGESVEYRGTYSRPSGLRYAQRVAAESLINDGDIVGRYEIFLDYVSGSISSLFRGGESIPLPGEPSDRRAEIDSLGFQFVMQFVKEMQRTASPTAEAKKK